MVGAPSRQAWRGFISVTAPHQPGSAQHVAQLQAQPRVEGHHGGPKASHGLQEKHQRQVSNQAVAGAAAGARGAGQSAHSGGFLCCHHARPWAPAYLHLFRAVPGLQWLGRLERLLRL